MIAPRKTKFRASFVRNVGGVADRGTDLVYGEYGLITLENDFITPNQIEAARRMISHATKRSGKVWIRIFPDQPMTTKPANVRMGSGKGPVTHYVAHVKRGRVIFEIGGISKELAHEALRKGSRKLPVKTLIIEK